MLRSTSGMSSLGSSSGHQRALQNSMASSSPYCASPRRAGRASRKSVTVSALGASNQPGRRGGLLATQAVSPGAVSGILSPVDEALRRELLERVFNDIPVPSDATEELPVHDVDILDNRPASDVESLQQQVADLESLLNLTQTTADELAELNAIEVSWFGGVYMVRWRHSRAPSGPRRPCALPPFPAPTRS